MRVGVGPGLVHFVCGLHSRLATGVTSSRIIFPPFFHVSFLDNASFALVSIETELLCIIILLAQVE